MNTDNDSKILVLDDEPRIAEMTQVILETEGYEVITTSTGHECLRLAMEEDIALIILDIKIPDMDGWTLFDKLRNENRTRDIPIIILTAKAEEWEKKMGLDKRGVEDYITKPFEPDELIIRIRKVLEHRNFNLL
jgi:two-component system alkaline phosphatase synthesis response regulator PhoP